MSYSRHSNTPTVALMPVTEAGLAGFVSHLPDSQQRWLKNSGFKAKAGQSCLVPAEDGGLAFVAFGQSGKGWLGQLAELPSALPEGNYHLESDWDQQQRTQACLGWGLASYRFERYLKKKDTRATLVLEEDIADRVEALCEAQSLVRDLVNTPTEDMGPAQLADAVVSEANRFGADSKVVKGEKLLTKNFPAIHIVGRAADRKPRLASLTWGKEDAPLVALVGKGVCFDTGGLNLKPTSGMGLMKKDMGGAAHVLALAQLVMRYELPVRLMLLIPAVENAVSGNAYRPGDVINTRKGLTVEIGNTDAEGRIVLSDALAFACEHKPDLVIDFATLTGAARVAMGADLPPLFSNRPDVSAAIQLAGDQVEDPLWTLPLHQPYLQQMKSNIADLNNAAKSSYGGCITAALFLQEFVDKEIPWVHIDTFAWNQANRPGRPKGGEALGLRAVFAFLENRYG
jgi:leucyl aminopeptidase